MAPHRVCGVILIFALGKTKMPGLRSLFGIAAIVLAACVAHTTNVQVGAPTTYDPTHGYRFDPTKSSQSKTLIVITFSGGGMRAAALAFGTLQALRALPGTVPGSTLLDQIALISSVSGGSVTAGWYALNGPEGFEKPESSAAFVKYLHNIGDVDLALRGLNPIALTAYAVTPYQRSDVLSEYFSDHVFHGATFADVDRKYRSDPRQAFVILNSTDLAHKIRFPFTQNRFDLLCSDLNSYAVADAVGASADFPFVFSPTGITNYSPCAQQKSDTWTSGGPGKWLSRYLPYEQSYSDYGNQFHIDSSDALVRLQIGLASLEDYIHHKPNDTYLHLLDGGLIDNLGIRSTLEIEDNPALPPGLVFRLLRDIPPYDHIDRILYIVVNARSSESTGIDASVYPPGLLSTGFRVAYAPIDSASADTQLLLTETLVAITELKRRAGHQIQGYVVTVDPDLIVDQTCRRYFLALPTNWQLSDAEVGSLIALPEALLAVSPDLRRFYSGLNLSAANAVDFSAACATSHSEGDAQSRGHGVLAPRAFERNPMTGPRAQ